MRKRSTLQLAVLTATAATFVVAGGASAGVATAAPATASSGVTACEPGAANSAARVAEGATAQEPEVY
jgi:hypothetical protein